MGVCGATCIGFISYLERVIWRIIESIVLWLASGGATVLRTTTTTTWMSRLISQEEEQVAMYETSGVEVELGNKSWSSGNLHLIDCVLSRARNNFAQTYSAHHPCTHLLRGVRLVEGYTEWKSQRSQGRVMVDKRGGGSRIVLNFPLTRNLICCYIQSGFNPHVSLDSHVVCDLWDVVVAVVWGLCAKWIPGKGAMLFKCLCSR